MRQAKDRGLYEKLLGGKGGEKPPRASAAVVPWRRGGGGRLEVFWVQRSRELPFMGGWWAFPGGGLSRRDAGVEVAGSPAGASADGFTTPHPELDAAERARLGGDLVPGLVAAALRELFEETGVLLAEGLPANRRERLGEARRRLLDRETSFAELAAAEGWRLDASRLVFAGRWLTPPLAPLRFDNRFFLAELGGGDPAPEVCGRELERGEWIAPAEAVERWRSGEVMTAPPILHLLRVLAEDGPEEGLGRLRDASEADLGGLRRIEFRPGVLLLPLRTATLLPATRTNAYLLGLEEAVLVDPPTSFPDEVDLLRRAVAAADEVLGRRVSAIWLTHHHPDHVGAVEVMRRELGVPVLAHRLAAEHLAERGIVVNGELEDGQRVVLGGETPFPVRVLHTPGHTRGHLSFYDETFGSLIAGDLVAGLGTIVVDPPEGDMSAYIASLERMMELEPRTLFPAHGPAILQAVEKLAEYRHHRLWREQKVLAAWRAGRKTPRAMVAEVYDDAPREAYPLAERQIRAHLERLEKLGQLTDA